MDKRVGLLAGLLVLLLTPGAVAQPPSPEPPPWLGGRVEMPEYGFAVTVLDDWVAYDPASDADSQVEAVSGLWDPAIRSVAESKVRGNLALAASAGIHLYSANANGDTCLWMATPVSVVPAQDMADLLFARYVDDPTARDVEPSLRVDLPAGPAYVVRMSRYDGLLDRWSPMSAYHLSMSEGVLLVVCTAGDARPDDDWLSIVEPVEFLPAKE